jgi:hypothetical protein
MACKELNLREREPEEQTVAVAPAPDQLETDLAAAFDPEWVPPIPAAGGTSAGEP